MSGPVQPVTTFWRLAGMSYLQYVTRSASAVRSALKEPAQLKAQTQEIFTYKAAAWKDGQMGAKTVVTTLGVAGTAV